MQKNSPYTASKDDQVSCGVHVLNIGCSYKACKYDFVSKLSDKKLPTDVVLSVERKQTQVFCDQISLVVLINHLGNLEHNIFYYGLIMMSFIIYTWICPIGIWPFAMPTAIGDQDDLDSWFLSNRITCKAKLKYITQIQTDINMYTLKNFSCACIRAITKGWKPLNFTKS